MKRTTFVLALVASAALAVAASAGAAARPGFPPGTWVGSGTQKGLFSVLPGDPSPVDGTASFTLAVSRSLQVTGSLTLRTRMTVDHAGLRGVVVGVATVPLSGTGTSIRFAGPMRLTGKLTDGKLTVPFALTKPVSGRLTVTRAGCLAVTGTTDSQLAFAWKAVPKPGAPRPRCT